MKKETLSQLLAELPESGSPPPCWGERTLAALRSQLALELHRRGLWRTDPRHLGVEAASWQEGLEELAADAYAFVFLDRLSALQAQRKVRPDVDGLVVLNVRHFLHARQKENDRLGYRAYDVLRCALRELITAGELWVLAGDAEIRNDTELGFAPVPDGELASPDLLAELARRWNDELLPDLMAAQGAGRLRVLRKLRRLLAAMPQQGAARFRFRDLLAPLKADLRLRWAATFVHEGIAEHSEATLGRQLFPFAKRVDPRLEVEQRDGFQKLVNCVSKQIEHEPTHDGLRRDLALVWAAVRAWAHDASAPQRPPSQRGLAVLLGLSRERVGVLMERLRGLIDRCQVKLAGRLARLTPREVPK